MGSTLLTLRETFGAQSDYDTIDSASDPSATLVNSYINKAIRTIVRRDRPRELLLSAPVDISTTSGQNSVTIPSTVFVPTDVYFLQTSSKYKEIRILNYKTMLQRETPRNFFDTTNTGTPDFCSIRGTSLIFNKYFTDSNAAGVKLNGVSPPTTLSSDTDTTELPEDYDFLIAYEAIALFYQRDDDTENQIKFQGLAAQERSELKLSLDPNNQEMVEMDPYTFTQFATDIGNPNVFFTS